MNKELLLKIKALVEYTGITTFPVNYAFNNSLIEHGLPLATPNERLGHQIKEVVEIEGNDFIYYRSTRPYIKRWFRKAELDYRNPPEQREVTIEPSDELLKYIEKQARYDAEMKAYRYLGELYESKRGKEAARLVDTIVVDYVSNCSKREKV